MGLPKPCKTCGLTGIGPGLARQDAGGRVFGRVRIRTELFLQSKTRPLAGYPDPFLTPDRNLWHMQTAVPRISQRAKD